MDRKEAVLKIARFPRGLVSIDNAKAVAEACGVHLETLLFLEENLIRKSGKGWSFKRRQENPAGADIDLVQLSDLAAVICRYMGLYGDRDHSLASPHGTPGKQADYVGHRAAIRLARQFWGEEGVRDLAAMVRIEPSLLKERVFKPSCVWN